MKTVIIQIGNSDNKLAQLEWASFVEAMRFFLATFDTHFFGGCENWAAWQNVCWVLLVNENAVPAIIETVKNIRERWKQDSAAVTIGETQFI